MFILRSETVKYTITLTSRTRGTCSGHAATCYLVLPALATASCLHTRGCSIFSFVTFSQRSVTFSQRSHINNHTQYIQ